MTEQSLYERLEGVNAIAMVVDRFSDKIVENPKLNVNPQLREWNGKGLLPGLKFMRTLWLRPGWWALSIHGKGAARGPQGSPHHL